MLARGLRPDVIGGSATIIVLDRCMQWAEALAAEKGLDLLFLSLDNIVNGCDLTQSDHFCRWRNAIRQKLITAVKAGKS